MEIPDDDTCSEELKLSCWNNAEYYRKDDTESGQRLLLGFLGIVDHVNTILPLMHHIQKVMAAYDFDETTPGNGYRSFVIVLQAAFKHGLELCNYVTLNRDSIMFRKGFYMKEVEAVSHMIASLSSCFRHLHSLLSWSEIGELFPSSEHHSHILLEQSDTINQYAFYGRCLAIQFCSSVQPLLKFISIFMASFSEMYYNMGSLSARAQGLLSGGKLLIDPELRARRIVNISLYASIDFCKSFWFLAESELMKKIPDLMCDALAINAEIKIPPEPLQISNSRGIMVDIPIPSSHVEISSIQVRLLSSSRREGMIAVSSDSNKKNCVISPSQSLILHCHGGGFVAQSSKSHEVYLRDWASNLNVPIVSVDYSLAPEAPFPRALEEVFYSYCWALKNCRLLGSTGEKIILAGDSAGANLLLGVALKCIEYDIRKPNGLFLAYVPVIVSSTPSPSRLLCLMDPLLPIGFLLRCLKAYACPDLATHHQNSDDHDLSNLSSQKMFKYFDSDTNSNQNSNLMCPSTFSKPVCDVPECSSNTLYKPSLSDASKFANGETQTDSNEKLACGWENKSVDHFFGSNPEESECEKMEGIAEKNFKRTFSSMKKKVSNLFSNTFKKAPRKVIDVVLTGNDLDSTNIPVNPFKEFKFSVPRDPYLSPYWASDDTLRRLPSISICSVEFDPCLDDCVMFAKKLKKLGNDVRLDILEGLPHGFLNFSKVNRDAAKGSKICMKRIQELLDRENSSKTEEPSQHNLGVESQCS